MDLGYLLRDKTSTFSAAQTQNRPALALGDKQTWTYAELTREANRISHFLLREGVLPGDRVGLLMHNSLEYVAAIFGASRIGAVAVRYNWRLSDGELWEVMRHSECSALIGHDRVLRRVHHHLDDELAHRSLAIGVHDADSDQRFNTASSLRDVASTEPDVPTPSGDAAAVVMYTSGSTGAPKAVPWTHSSLLNFAQMQSRTWGIGRESVCLVTGPQFHVSSFENLVLPALLGGGKAVILESQNFEVRALLRMIAEHHVTDALVFPSMVHQMLRDQEWRAERLNSMQHLFTGGSPLAEWAVSTLKSEAPHMAIYALYGSTEGGAMSTFSSLHLDDVPAESVGAPLPMNEVKIAQGDGAAVTLGEEGEIWVRGPAMAREYWRNSEATAKTFVEGWCRTGDRGRISGGHLYVTGRANSLIKSGGENVYPEEVEAVLESHPDVVEAAVTAMPDDTYAEGVAALVVIIPRSSTDQETLIAYCKERLASYKKPRRITFVEKIPRTPTGKIRRGELTRAIQATPN